MIHTLERRWSHKDIFFSFGLELIDGSNPVEDNTKIKHNQWATGKAISYIINVYFSIFMEGGVCIKKVLYLLGISVINVSHFLLCVYKRFLSYVFLSTFVMRQCGCLCNGFGFSLFSLNTKIHRSPVCSRKRNNVGDRV